MSTWNARVYFRQRLKRLKSKEIMLKRDEKEIHRENLLVISQHANVPAFLHSNQPHGNREIKSYLITLTVADHALRSAIASGQLLSSRKLPPYANIEP